MNIKIRKDIYEEIKNILKTTRENILFNINSTMTKTYFLIIKIIVEEKQNGNKRVEYGNKFSF